MASTRDLVHYQTQNSHNISNMIYLAAPKLYWDGRCGVKLLKENFENASTW